MGGTGAEQLISATQRSLRTDFDVGPLRLHQLVDDLAEFVGVGELPLGGGARRGRQGRHGAGGEG